MKLKIEGSIQIHLWNEDRTVLETHELQPLAANRFRMEENAICDHRLTFGTEFEARPISDDQYQLERITQSSAFTTRRFQLSNVHKESEYQALGEELMKHGGFWQVDFGSLAIINLPPAFPYEIDTIIKMLGLEIIELRDDN